MTQHGAPGARIPFKRQGGAKPVAVLIHGFLDAGEVWDIVADRLSAEGISTAVFDLPGMGGTTASASEISLDRYAEDVCSVVTEIGGPVILVGQSMGSQIAELVAVQIPDQVKGLVLLTPVPLGGAGAPEDMVAPFATSGGKPEQQKGLRSHLSFSLDGAALDALSALGNPVAADVVAKLVETWNVGHPLGNAPSTFAGPAQIIRGAADPFVDEAMAARTASRFASSDVVAIESAGHWPHVEQPDEIAKIITEFVRAVATSAPGAGSDWKGAFSKQSSQAFGEAFAEDVTLEASVLNVPVIGRDNVKKVMEAASKIYAALTFTDQATAGTKQYLEWKATAHSGVEFDGVTVLTRNAEGAIAHVAIHHRPMLAAIYFSQTMGESLAGIVDAAHFLPKRPLAEVE